MSVFVEEPALAPEQVVPELSFVTVSVFVKDLAKPLLVSSPELALVLEPVIAVLVVVVFTLAFEMVVAPLPFVLQVPIRVEELSLPFHFTLYPVSKVVTSIRVNVFALAVTQVVPLLAFVPVAVCVYF